MAKATKSTKKFQSKHLKHTIEQRKQVQKYNKTKGKKKSKTSEAGDEAHLNESRATKEVFEDMPMDEFFEGGFEVPSSKKRGNDVGGDESGSESESENGSSDDSSVEDEETMKRDLDNLAEKDPEFYKYLEDNDKDLLDFEAVNPLDAMDDDVDEDDEDVESEKKETKKEKGKSKETKKVEITEKVIQNWRNSLQKPSCKTIKNVAVAFRAAVNINDNEIEYKYTVTDPRAFQSMMFLGLKDLPEAIQRLVKYKVNPQTGARSIPQNNADATKIASILKAHAGSYITLLKDINNTETAALVLASIQEVFPYYISYRKLLKRIITAVVDVWATTSDIDTQIATFAFLNNCARENPKANLESILKIVYSSFLRNARKTNAYTVEMINFCKNSASELFGINETLSYQVGFEYIRQLAIHLRNSINATSNAKEGYKTVYNWQYCHSLDFWSRVLSQHCNPESELKFKNKESPLRSLIYPLVQVTLGTIKLIPTAQFFPLRFYLIRSLMRLSQSTDVYIPVYPLISEVLTSTSITKAPKASNIPALDFETNIKVNQAYLGTRVYQEGLCEQFVELTSEFFALHCKSIAFPELATPAILSLRRFTKKSKNIKFNKQLQQLVEKLSANSNLILSKRSNVHYGPSNKEEVKLFLKDLDWQKTPLGQYVVIQRKSKEEKIRLLKEALEETAKNKKQEQGSDSEMDAIDELSDAED